jgi:hypothetical protein
LKDTANAKEIIEEDEEELLAKNKTEEKTIFFEDKNVENVTFANKTNLALVDNSPSDLINVSLPTNEPQKQETIKPVANLLDMEGETEKKEQPSPPPQPQPQPQPQASKGSLLDLDNDPSPPKSFNTSVPAMVESTEISGFSTSVNQSSPSQGSSFNFMDIPATNSKNIIVPYVPVIAETDSSRENKYSGLGVKAAFQREGEKVYLQALFSNQSQIVMNVLSVIFRTLP